MEAELASSDEAGASTAVAKSRRRALVVDDSAVIRSITRRMFERMAFDVFEAENGQVALDVCAEIEPDVVLLDWNMPVMDGLRFLTILRAGSQTSQPRVVFCTTEQSVDSISQALSAGADEFIMKPFDEEILRLKLAAVGLGDDRLDVSGTGTTGAAS